MDPEGLEPQTPKPRPKDLEVMSIEALRDYIGTLEAEIARARDAIQAKEMARQGAESVFKL